MSSAQSTRRELQGRNTARKETSDGAAVTADTVSQIEPELLRLSGRERVALLGQLSVMLDSGIQVPAALLAMKEQSENPRMADVLAYAGDAVQGGAPLSKAMMEMPRAFPVLVGQMVAAGEQAGRMGEMILRLVEMLEAEDELRGRVRSALLYPTIMVVVATCVVIFLITAIVPKFAGLFKGKEAVLPAPTRLLMSTGEFFSANWMWLIPSVLVLFIGTIVYLRSEDGKPVLDAVILRIPVVRDVYRTAILSRTSRTLGTLVQSGVAITVAIEHTRDVSGSPAYAKLWSKVHDDVMNGTSISDSIRPSPLLPATYKQMISAGESGARLDKVLIKVASHYASELQRKVHDVTTVVEPALVVIMGCVVGFIALSIMLPIFQLSRNV